MWVYQFGYLDGDRPVWINPLWFWECHDHRVLDEQVRDTVAELPLGAARDYWNDGIPGIG